MKNLKVHNIIAFIKNKFILKRENKTREQITDEAIKKIIADKIRRRSIACDELREKIIGTTFMRDHEGREMPVPDELKEQFLTELQVYRESDYIRHVISREESEDTICTDYLSYDSKGISYGTDLYSIGIDGHFHTHYYEPEEILYRYSLVQKEKEKEHTKS